MGMTIQRFSTRTAGRQALLMAAAATVAIGTLSSSASADEVFDNTRATAFTGENITTTGSIPNTFMGDAYNLAPGTTDITGFDVFPVNLTGTTYTGIQGTIYVWGGVNTGPVSATAPAFSNLLGTYTFGATGTFASGQFFSFASATPGVTPGITLTTPLQLSGISTIGLTFSYAGTTDGVNFATANKLTSLIKYDGTTPAVPTIGSEVFNGYYRNANSETNGNFTSSLRSLGQTDQSLAVDIYGDVAAAPEPTSLLLAGMAAGPLVLRRRRRPATTIA